MKQAYKDDEGQQFFVRTQALLDELACTQETKYNDEDEFVDMGNSQHVFDPLMFKKDLIKIYNVPNNLIVQYFQNKYFSTFEFWKNAGDQIESMKL